MALGPGNVARPPDHCSVDALIYVYGGGGAGLTCTSGTVLKARAARMRDNALPIRRTSTRVGREMGRDSKVETRARQSEKGPTGLKGRRESIEGSATKSLNLMLNSMALGPTVRSSPTASARAWDTNRRGVCAYLALGPTRGPWPVRLCPSGERSGNAATRRAHPA